MERKITRRLLDWKNSPGRKPLIVYGARQVGKTYSVNEFGRNNYKDVVYLNFETNERLAKEFDSDISPDFLLNRMELFFEKRIIPGETLIIFDEVQVCERALTSLKYFCENAPGYHIIATGSIMGVAFNRKKYSFPVGKVDMLTMFPLDFEEFLMACGRKLLIGEIRKCFENNQPMSEALHQLALEYYKTYLVVGGMPAAINEYLKEHRMFDAINAQSLILNAYIADMAKYMPAPDAAKTLACFNSIPAQLAKQNRKFQYKVVQKGGSASLFGTSIDWLSAAGIVLKCSRIEHGYMPLASYQDLSSYKIYMNDVGLLTLKSGMVPHDVVGNVNNLFIGAITENYVASMLHANGFELYYWTSGSQAEVDFVIQDYDDIVPVEVKTNMHVKSRSLSVYMQKYKPRYALRISAKNFGLTNSVRSIPLYAIFCITPKKPEI